MLPHLPHLRCPAAASMPRPASGARLAKLLPILGAALLAFVPLVADDADPGDPAQDPAAATTPATPPKNSLLEPNEEQLKAETEFLDKVAQTLSAGNGDFLDENTDATTLTRAACRGLGLTSKELTDLAAGFKKNFALGSQVVADFKDGGGSYKFIAVRTIAGQRRALFRLYYAGHVAFHDLVLSKNARGHYQVADVYIYLAADLLSNLIRRQLIPILTKEKPDRARWLSPTEKLVLEHQPDLLKVLEAAQQKKYAEAQKLFLALPPTLYKDRAVLLAGLAVSAGDDQTFDNFLKTFHDNFPDEIAADFVAIDAQFAAKHYDGVIASLDRIEKQVGVDPLLETYRGNCRMAQGKTDEAVKLFHAAIEADKSLDLPYNFLAQIACQAKKWDEVSQVLGDYEQASGKSFGDLTRLPAYADFLKSAQGKSWQAAHAAKK